MAQGLCSACQCPGLGLDSWPWGPALDSPPVCSPKTPSPSVEGPSDLGENHKWALSVRSGWTEIRATCLLPRDGRGLKGHPLSCYWLPPTQQQSGLDVRIRPCLSRLQTPRLLTHSSEIPAAPLALSHPHPSRRPLMLALPTPAPLLQAPCLQGSREYPIPYPPQELCTNCSLCLEHFPLRYASASFQSRPSLTQCKRAPCGKGLSPTLHCWMPGAGGSMCFMWMEGQAEGGSWGFPTREGSASLTNPQPPLPHPTIQLDP